MYIYFPYHMFIHWNYVSVSLYAQFSYTYIWCIHILYVFAHIWANYNDLTRPHTPNVRLLRKVFQIKFQFGLGELLFINSSLSNWTDFIYDNFIVYYEVFFFESNSLAMITVLHDQTCLTDPILETVSTMCELYCWRTRSWKRPEILTQNKIDRKFLPSTLCHAIPNIMSSFVLGFDSKDLISTDKRSTRVAQTWTTNLPVILFNPSLLEHTGGTGGSELASHGLIKLSNADDQTSFRFLFLLLWQRCQKKITWGFSIGVFQCWSPALPTQLQGNLG